MLAVIKINYVINVYIYIYINKCIYIYIYVCTYIYILINKCIYIYIFINKCIYVYIYIYIIIVFGKEKRATINLRLLNSLYIVHQVNN